MQNEKRCDLKQSSISKSCLEGSREDLSFKRNLLISAPELATLSTGSVLPMSTCPKSPRGQSHDGSSEDLIEKAAKQVESELIQMTLKGPASHSRFKFKSLRKKATIM